MGSQKQLIYLQNKATGEIYHTRKNKKLVERKLKFKKFSKKLRKHAWFEEVKKPAKVKKVQRTVLKKVEKKVAKEEIKKTEPKVKKVTKKEK